MAQRVKALMHSLWNPHWWKERTYLPELPSHLHTHATEVWVHTKVKSIHVKYAYILHSYINVYSSLTT